MENEQNKTQAQPKSQAQVQPKFQSGIVVNIPMMVSDVNGEFWFIDPEKQTIKQVKVED